MKKPDGNFFDRSHPLGANNRNGTASGVLGYCSMGLGCEKSGKHQVTLKNVYIKEYSSDLSLPSLPLSSYFHIFQSTKNPQQKLQNVVKVRFRGHDNDPTQSSMVHHHVTGDLLEVPRLPRWPQTVPTRRRRAEWKTSLPNSPLSSGLVAGKPGFGLVGWIFCK